MVEKVKKFFMASKLFEAGVNQKDLIIRKSSFSHHSDIQVAPHIAGIQ